MAARAQRLVPRILTSALAVLVAVLACVLYAQQAPGRASAGAAERTPPAAQRIVSLVPSLTEDLFAVGAGPQVVAVSSFDSYPPEVTKLPRVGALLDPDYERILRLKPDLVVTYGSQSDLSARLKRAGIRTYDYRHGGLAVVLQTLRELGALSGHANEADRVARDLQARLDAVKRAVAGSPRPRTLMVFDRAPFELRQIYANGGRGFLHELMEIAGAANVFADVDREATQPSIETLLARAPDVILEVRAGSAAAADVLARERGIWQRLSSIPAVKNGRIHFLYGDQLVVPGPRLGLAAEMLARAIHPESFPAGPAPPR